MNYVPGRRSLWVFDFDGTRITDPNAMHVEDPACLARAVREFADAAPKRDMEDTREEWA
jgi:hypothetical protein